MSSSLAAKRARRVDGSDSVDPPQLLAVVGYTLARLLNAHAFSFARSNRADRSSRFRLSRMTRSELCYLDRSSRFRLSWMTRVSAFLG